MQNVVVELQNGDILEFAGELVSSSQREVFHDARRSTVFEYRLYRRAEGGFTLVLDSFEKIRARNFHLAFKTLDDVRDYVKRDAGGEALARDLVGEGSGKE